MEHSSLIKKYRELCRKLSEEQNSNGFWTGRLSTSALSSAVSITALRLSGDPADERVVVEGISWLCRNINNDGGYGDTPGSASNISTTLLSWAALRFCCKNEQGKKEIESVENWLSLQNISTDPESVTRSVLSFYGNDYTFSVPILSMLLLTGVIPPSSIKKIPSLPFEFALLPSSFYRFLNLRVVSYAMPALIGVGIFLHKKKGGGFLNISRLRNRFTGRALKKLNSLVPESGGFLEAIPLTAFVSMCLIASGESENETVKKGLEFLRRQMRNDGGWPIDTDLSTWVTTLSVKALGGDFIKVLGDENARLTRSHLLGLQYKEIHPFNGAIPGGWGWTSYSGSVPDADDTAGAILALTELFQGSDEEVLAIKNGCKWLIGLQNKDGGFPTFCRGFGKLPFDKSCPDLTGHAILAMGRSIEKMGKEIDTELIARMMRSIAGAVDYLSVNQSGEGYWLPLWFGNQLTKNKTNPVYGTSRVCVYLSDFLKTGIGMHDQSVKISNMVYSARQFLAGEQNKDGSWGGALDIEGTIEETAITVSALAGENIDACLKGLGWLAEREELKVAPIGLYFAMLWYDEKMYPLVYYLEAVRRTLER